MEAGVDPLAESNAYLAAGESSNLFAKPTGYAATHGSPWSYDTNVPLVMYGPAWIKEGKYGDSEVVDLGRTVAHIMNVRPPSRSGCIPQGPSMSSSATEPTTSREWLALRVFTAGTSR